MGYSMPGRKILGLCCCIMLVTAAVGACGGEGDDDNNNGGLLENGDNENQEPEENQNQPQENQNTEPGTCGDTECADDEVCFEGQCELATDAGFSCFEPNDLGELSADAEEIISAAAATGQANVLSTECGSDHEDSPQAVFSFSVAEPMQIDLSIDEAEDPVVVEMRTGDCRDQEAATSCDNDLEQTHYAEPGQTYFLIVEPVLDWNLGEFSIGLNTSALLCAPPGQWSCDGDNRVQCFAGVEERTYACGGGCTDGVCHGASCENPIEVTEAITVDGELGAYDSSGRFDFADSPACSTQGATGPTTEGQDLVFSLPGLVAGQQVIVDTSESDTSNVIGILQDCSEEMTECIAGNDTDDFLEWTVEADGDYFVVIDQFTTDSGPFSYSIEIIE